MAGGSSKKRSSTKSLSSTTTTLSTTEANAAKKPRRKAGGQSIVNQSDHRNNGGLGLAAVPIPVVRKIAENATVLNLRFDTDENNATLHFTTKSERDKFIEVIEVDNFSQFKTLTSRASWKTKPIILCLNPQTGPWDITFRGVSNLEDFRLFGRDTTSGRRATAIEKGKILTSAIVTATRNGNTGSMPTAQERHDIEKKLKEKGVMGKGKGGVGVLLSKHKYKMVNSNSNIAKPFIIGGSGLAATTTASWVDNKMMYLDTSGDIPTLGLKSQAARLKSAQRKKAFDDHLRSKGMQIPMKSVDQIMKDRYENKTEDTSVFEAKDVLA